MPLPCQRPLVALSKAFPIQMILTFTLPLAILKSRQTQYRWLCCKELFVAKNSLHPPSGTRKLGNWLLSIPDQEWLYLRITGLRCYDCDPPHETDTRACGDCSVQWRLSNPVESNKRTCGHAP